MQDIMKMTKKEFDEISIQRDDEIWFNGFIVVPMPLKHDSGWQSMKYILLQDRIIVGCIGGTSDVILLRNINWQVDCLPKSKLLRFFTSKHIKVSNVSCFSDFIIPMREG